MHDVLRSLSMVGSCKLHRALESDDHGHDIDLNVPDTSRPIHKILSISSSPKPSMLVAVQVGDNGRTKMRKAGYMVERERNERAVLLLSPLDNEEAASIGDAICTWASTRLALATRSSLPGRDVLV